MLYLIGLGLYDERDLSLRALDSLKECDAVYAETYTCPWHGSLKKLEDMCGKKITPVERSFLEEDDKKLIEEAKNKDVAILIPGDPLAATTHASLISGARKTGTEVRVVHSSSIFSAVAETGLHLYKFGKTATVAYPEKGYFPKTPYGAIGENKKIDAHTLLLLDVKPSRFMTVNEAIDIMLELEEKEKRGLFTEDTFVLGVGNLGSLKPTMKSGKVRDMKKQKFGETPHVLIVPGKLHFSEEELL